MCQRRATQQEAHKPGCSSTKSKALVSRSVCSWVRAWTRPHSGRGPRSASSTRGPGIDPVSRGGGCRARDRGKLTTPGPSCWGGHRVAAGCVWARGGGGMPAPRRGQHTNKIDVLLRGVQNHVSCKQFKKCNVTCRWFVVACFLLALTVFEIVLKFPLVSPNVL